MEGFEIVGKVRLIIPAATDTEAAKVSAEVFGMVRSALSAAVVDRKLALLSVGIDSGGKPKAIPLSGDVIRMLARQGSFLDGGDTREAATPPATGRTGKGKGRASKVTPITSGKDAAAGDGGDKDDSK